MHRGRVALANILCSQEDTVISLSTELAGYGFGEWATRLSFVGAALILKAQFRPKMYLYGDDFVAAIS